MPLHVLQLEDRLTPATASDPAAGSQWGLAAISAGRGWDVSTGTGTTIVAVIDTGVDLYHADLERNLWRNPGEIPDNGRDDDGNGFADDINGYDFANNDPVPWDDRGHGTHVAGIIGAAANNGVGGSGVAWHTRIMPIKFQDAAGNGSIENAAKAVDYAVRNGAKIINASWATPADDPLLSAAIGRARAAGVIMVTAAGNSGANLDGTGLYPASYARSFDNTIAVAATTQSGGLANWSNFGPNSVLLGAPGDGIVSDAPGGGTATKSGTSMAAPFVAGALAVLWDTHPTWTYQQILAKLRTSTDPLPALAGKVATGGQLDLAKLLDAPAVTVPPPPVSPPPPASSGIRWTGAGARVTSGQFLGGTAGTFDRVRVTFDKKMNAPTFTPSDVTLTGPAGRITVSTVSVVAGTTNTTFDITFAAQSAGGTYTLTAGPDVWDVTGQRMDQNGNGVNNEAGDGWTLSATLTGGSNSVAPPASTRTVAGVLNGNTISDFRTSRATFAVPDDFAVTDIRVTLDISHSRTSDLQIRLTAPDGRRVVLFNRGGGATLSGVTFSTAGFAGVRAKGEWVLEVFDVVTGEGGVFRGASVSL